MNPRKGLSSPRSILPLTWTIENQKSVYVLAFCFVVAPTIEARRIYKKFTFCTFFIHNLRWLPLRPFSLNLLSGRPPQSPTLYYITFFAFCQDGKLHKNIFKTLCNLPIAIYLYLWYTIIVVKREHKKSMIKIDRKKIKNISKTPWQNHKLVI